MQLSLNNGVQNKRVPPSDRKGCIQDRTIALNVKLQPQIFMIWVTAYGRWEVVALASV